MDHDAVLLTQSGVEKLKKEREQLINIERPKVIEELQLARSQGDLSENADYDAAREHQAQVEGRIRELEAMIKNAEIISEVDNAEDKKKKNVVKLGSTVKILDLSDNQEVTFNIVGTIEADPFNGKLSNTTPLAEVIMDHKVGDVCTVRRVEEPYDVKILEIK